MFLIFWKKTRVYYTLIISRWGGGGGAGFATEENVCNFRYEIRVSINSMFNSDEPTRYFLIDVLHYLSHNMT